jgi:alpha-galactosidase
MMFSRTIMIAATAVTSAAALNVLKYTTTPNGFHNAPRGFNTWPIQANPRTTPSWTAFDEANVKAQCGVLAQPDFQAAGYKYCSLDSGWSQDGGDENGRILYDPAKFDLPEFGNWLHDQGLLLGIYILPGFFCSDSNKTILGTDIPLSNIWNGNDNGFLRCDIDTTKDGSQEWHDSIIELFAEWGVDFVSGPNILNFNFLHRQSRSNSMFKSVMPVSQQKSLTMVQLKDQNGFCHARQP